MPSQYVEELNTAERAAREAGRIISALFKGKFDVHEKSKNNPVTTADLEANRKIREILQGRFPEDGWLSEEDSDDSRRLTSSRVWIISTLFKGKFDVHEKSKNNPVTTADLEANRKIREILQGRFPEDGWLSEEDSDDSRRLTSSRVWIIDPIDGTKEFIEGVPQFAVSIGFVVRGRPKVAVIYNPIEDRLYRAAAGQGAELNGERIRVTPRREVRGALLLVSRSEPLRKFQIFVDLCEIQSVGSIAYRLAKVAGGEGDGTLTFRSIHEWDVCAGALMVEEAGGKVVDGNGKTLLFNRRETKHHGIVASNEKLTDEIQGLVATVLAAKQGNAAVK